MDPAENVAAASRRTRSGSARPVHSPLADTLVRLFLASAPLDAPRHPIATPFRTLHPFAYGRSDPAELGKLLVVIHTFLVFDCPGDD